MSTQAKGTLETLVAGLVRAVDPLQRRLSADQVLDLFAQLGLVFPPTLLSQAGFTGALNVATGAAAGLEPLLNQLSTASESGDVTQILEAVGALGVAVGILIHDVDLVADQLRSLANALPPLVPNDVSAFADSLTAVLFDRLLVEYLEDVAPQITNGLALIGLVDRHYVNGSLGVSNKPAFEVKRLRFDRLPQFLKDPAAYFQDLYGWGSAGFDAGFLFEQLYDVASLSGVPALLASPSAASPRSLDLFAVSLHPDPTSNPPGLRINLEVPIKEGLDINLPLPRSGWALDLIASGKFEAGLVGTLLPPADFSLRPSVGTLAGELRCRVNGQPARADGRFVIFGQTGGSRLDASSVRADIGATVSWDSASGMARAIPLVEALIKGGRLAISLAGSDGFLSKLLPADGIEVNFDFGAGWGERRGLYFTGSAGLETTIGLHASLGPFTLESLDLGLAASSTGLQLETSVTGSGELGPVAASVERVGLSTELRFQRGNLGLVDLGFAFKPPNGVGISVDAGPIAGGGYLFIDVPNGRYAGVLELKLYSINVKAIGLIDTKLPDGSSGFSFLIIITTEFTPIQLGFGFTLNGVGGLAGINRTMVLEALRAGVRTHALNSILFPEDPIHNAPKIISDLRTIFPAAEGRYVFGPMLKLGWGTPSLVTAELGVVLELPSPVRLAILGLLKAILPTEDAAVIELHVDVVGTVDFGAKKLSIDASLYDSRIVIFSVFGDMALRLDWGADPTFILSVGGFNPHYQPPAGLPALRRMTAGVSYGSYVRLSLEAYFAVTSNSLQFGAHAELLASAAGFTLHGFVRFDALIIFSPFGFLVEVHAGFELSFEGLTLLGIDLDVMLGGPSPWLIDGKVSITILFITISAHVHLTFGGDRPPPLPKKKVMEPLLAALNDPRGWAAVLPEGAERAVSLTGQKPADTTIAVHPLGTLTARENIVPLKTPITRFGNFAPEDGDTFEVASAMVNGQGEAEQDITDLFARGQFQDMSDADKIAARSFEPFPSGVSIGSTDTSAGNDAMLEVRYETLYVPDPYAPATKGRTFWLLERIHLALAAQGAAWMSPVLATGIAAYTSPGTVSAISTSEPAYLVVSTEDLSARYDLVGAGGTTQYMASVALGAHLASHPEERELLQVVPVYEAAGV